MQSEMPSRERAQMPHASGERPPRSKKCNRPSKRTNAFILGQSYSRQRLRFFKKCGVWNREGVEKFTHPRHGFENSESRTHDRMSASGIFSTWAKLFLRCIRIYINRSLSHLTKASVSTSDAQAALKALNSLQSLKWQKPKRFNNVSSHVR